MSDVDHARALARWRLVLGRFAEERVPLQGNASLARMDQMLDYLYGREYARRGVRAGSGSPGGGAGRGPSTLTVPDWIREVRGLFPADTCEVITRHALDRYGLRELVTDPETLQKLEPNYDLLKTLLTFRGLMTGPALELARKIIRQVVDDLRRRLSSDIRPVLWGRLDRTRRTRMRAAKNLDFRATVRANLQHWDVERKKLLARDLWFRSRVKRHLPWTIIIAVDCSGSMLDSVIHSAVMAGIFARLPAVRVKLLAFDTSVVDLSDTVDDPAELLMSVQLGGGTDIGGALAACASLVEQPTRTIVIVVTDFCEGGPPIRMLATIRKLRSEGVRVLGLAALDREAKPSYDRKIAEACADAGAEIGAFTPRHLAEWVAKVLS
ncbi:MAG TPA: VWA domain-containing protein [Polyangiaceae bacterium]